MKTVQQGPGVREWGVQWQNRVTQLFFCYRGNLYSQNTVPEFWELKTRENYKIIIIKLLRYLLLYFIELNIVNIYASIFP